MRSRMSLVPKMFSYWWETLERPHRLIDQHFGMNLRPEQLLNPALVEKMLDRSIAPFRPYPFSYYRPWAELMHDEDSGWSVVKNDKDKFQVALDVRQFKPDEIKVKVVDNFVVVEGKHEEKEDDHGIVSRHFVRKYMVPEQCDPEQTASTLSSDGILTITAPRKPESIQDKKERVIQVEHTSKPALENAKPKK